MALFTKDFTDPLKQYQYDDDAFATDHVMGDFNPHEPLGPDHDMQLYSDKRTRPRQKTRAKEVLRAVDDHQTFFGGAMDDELDLHNMTYKLGTDPELAKTYNRSDKAIRDNLARNQTEAGKWWDDATPQQ